MSTRRRWLEFVVVGVAAFASIATSKATGWMIEADVAKDAPSKARLVVLESTQRPTVQLDNGDELQPLDLVPTSPWGGTARYLVPRDRKLARIAIDGYCGGGCSGPATCDPPASARLKVLSIKPAESWRREVITAPVFEERDGGTTTIPFIASHPVLFEVTAQGRARYVSRSNNEIDIHWADLNDTRIKTTWSLRIVMEELCPTDAPCEPPPTSKLELGNPSYRSPGKPPSN